MSDTNGAAPHTCVDCGAPAYVGGPGMPCACTSRDCIFFDANIRIEWLMFDEDLGDPPAGCTEPDYFLDIDEQAKTDPGFLMHPGITFAGLPLYRDFCSSCSLIIEFTRRQDPVTGAFYAFCTQCGHPNVWL